MDYLFSNQYVTTLYNKFNNKLDNLRWVTQIENSENKKGVNHIEQWSTDKKELIKVFSESDGCI